MGTGNKQYNNDGLILSIVVLSHPYRALTICAEITQSSLQVKFSSYGRHKYTEWLQQVFITDKRVL